ncbi:MULTISPECIES: glycosyltransferase family 4 protein [Methylomicrobium]|uniref:Glycosyltransferase n=1 Tax=Methylomicrobium album BG8 TaxID=686340 RepID=H8GP99_METAL|nr:MULTISPECIES: glycosyltransferase family 4 protein [Methylomicrobium]EIC29685.1 glycosyltransferase [Methylomicrobium album BG8]
MKILLVSQYFFPEAFIVNDLVRRLNDLGHQVTVLTGKPNYPQGKIYDGYRLGGIQRERYAEAVEVIRVPLLPRGKGGGLRLAANYLSFVLSGLVLAPRLLRGRPFDAILVFAISPITQVIPAMLLKWLKGAHLAVWIQDLWPESVSATGFIRDPWLLKMIGWLVKGIYAGSDTLLVQSRAFTEPVARYARRDKIVYYPNSFEDKNETAADETLVPECLLETLENDFCLVFAGNLGTAQSLGTLVGAAERLRHLPDLKLVVVGSGSMQPWLEQQKSGKALDNLLLAGRFPPEAMGPIFRRAKGLLVTLKRDQIFSCVIPSKIQAYLAAGRPILAALDGEGAKVVEEARAGLTCPAEDAEALAECIRKLHAMDDAERDALGRSGRAYFLEQFEMAAQTQRLVEIFNQRIKETRR